MKESGEKPLRQFSPVHQGHSKDESKELSVTPPPGADAIADGGNYCQTEHALLYRPPVAHQVPPGYAVSAIAWHHCSLLAAT